MSFIEGIGDEVVLFFVVVIVFGLAALVTLIGSRSTVAVRRLSTRQRSARASQQALQQAPEALVFALRTSVNRDIQNSVQSEAVETTDRESSENNADISENEVASNLHEEQNGEESTNTARNDNFAGTNADQDTISVTEDSSRDKQTNLGDLHTRSNSDTITDRNTEAVEEFEQLPSEMPSAPPMEDNRANNRSDISQPPPPGEIRIRLKYLNDTERTVTSSPNTKIEDFKNKHFREDIRNNKVVRLIFAGRLLNNNSTLQNCRILDNSVVHVQVLQAPTTQNVPEASQEAELDVGRLLWPVLTAVLGLMWMTYLKYPEFYNLMSLGILLLFTGSFFFFLSHAQN